MRRDQQAFTRQGDRHVLWERGHREWPEQGSVTSSVSSRHFPRGARDNRQVAKRWGENIRWQLWCLQHKGRTIWAQSFYGFHGRKWWTESGKNETEKGERRGSKSFLFSVVIAILHADTVSDSFWFWFLYITMCALHENSSDKTTKINIRIWVTIFQISISSECLYSAIFCDSKYSRKYLS